MEMPLPQSQSEISNEHLFRFAVGIETFNDDVIRFEIAMRDIFSVQVLANIIP